VPVFAIDAHGLVFTEQFPRYAAEGHVAVARRTQRNSTKASACPTRNWNTVMALAKLADAIR
jgi:hypothetical protein